MGDAVAISQVDWIFSGNEAQARRLESEGRPGYKVQ